MTSKRFKVSLIYFVVVILTLLFRVASALDIYSLLGVQDDDAFWSCIVQIVIFGVVPFVMYLFMVAARVDKFLPYFPYKEKKEEEKKSDEIEVVFDDAALAPQSETSEIAVDENVAAPQPEPIEAEGETESKKKKASKMLKGLFADFGFKKVSLKSALCTIVLAICMTILGTAVSVVWQTVLSLFGYTRVPSRTDYNSLGVLFKELVLVAVLPGFFEEFSHRGLISAGYKQTGWKFVVLSATLFALMHQNIVQTGYTFVDGLAMALVMYYTGSIWPSMFMHFFNNAWSVFLGYVGQNGGVFAFINVIDNWLFSTVLGLLVCLLVVFLAIGLTVLMFVVLRKEAVKKGRIDEKPFAKTKTMPIALEAVNWLTVIVGVAATTFSLVWGIMR